MTNLEPNNCCLVHFQVVALGIKGSQTTYPRVRISPPIYELVTHGLKRGETGIIFEPNKETPLVNWLWLANSELS